MKRMEKLIIITCIFLVLGLVVQFGLRSKLPALAAMAGLEAPMALSVTLAIQGLFSLLVPLAIAVWLYREAKRDNELPWIWALLALTYQYIAPIFYIALKLYRSANASTGAERAAS